MGKARVRRPQKARGENRRNGQGKGKEVADGSGSRKDRMGRL